ncbi:hypothetical protein J6590_002671 [Homalodisca vitripennis]|nr:hypothetical protein J6590_002671 [Homalodisca vitripennis]
MDISRMKEFSGRVESGAGSICQGLPIRPPALFDITWNCIPPISLITPLKGFDDVMSRAHSLVSRLATERRFIFRIKPLQHCFSRRFSHDFASAIQDLWRVGFHGGKTSVGLIHFRFSFLHKRRRSFDPQTNVNVKAQPDSSGGPQLQDGSLELEGKNLICDIGSIIPMEDLWSQRDTLTKAERGKQRLCVTDIDLRSSSCDATDCASRTSISGRQVVTRLTILCVTRFKVRSTSTPNSRPQVILDLKSKLVSTGLPYHLLPDLILRSCTM